MPARRTIVRGAPLVVGIGTGGCIGSGGFGLQGGEADLPDKKREIIDQYEVGIEEYNAGVTGWDRGTTAFNDKEFNRAVDHLDEAVTQFESSRGTFSEAEEQARTIAETEAADICKEAAKRAGMMFEAARAGLKAARAGARDAGADTINDHITTAQSRKEAAEELAIEETDVLVSALQD